MPEPAATYTVILAFFVRPAADAPPPDADEICALAGEGLHDLSFRFQGANMDMTGGQCTVTPTSAEVLDGARVRT